MDGRAAGSGWRGSARDLSAHDEMMSLFTSTAGWEFAYFGDPLRLVSLRSVYSYRSVYLCHSTDGDPG